MYDSYFRGIIGHEELKKRLIRFLEKDRLPHALIFAGPAGVGKTMTAFALASAAAGRRLFADMGQKQDVPVLADGDDGFYLAPTSSMLKVEQFRQLQSRLMLQGRPGCRRFCIIDHVETMNAEFANRMLKILEEPPAGVCFILITDQPSLLLPTIVSRCVKICFDPVGDDEMKGGLVRCRGGAPSDYEQAVEWGAGIVRDVLAYLDGKGGEGEKALEFLRIVATHHSPYAKWLSVSGDMGEAETAATFRWIAMILRDMAVLHSGADPSLLRLGQYSRELTDLLPYWNEKGIFTMLQAIDEGAEGVTRHVNTRLIWDYVCIQCIRAKGGI